MKQVVVFRHAAHEGPGYLADFLARREIPHRLVRIDAGDPVPQSLDGVSGLVFMGGPMSVNDDLPWIPRVTDLIRRAIAAEVPVLGHCLGGQLMAKALGAPVTRNPVKEIGWLPVRVLDTPEAAAWFEGLPRELLVYHWHGETFAVPPGAARLLESEDCPNQAFALGKHLALQCHIEMTPDLIAAWLEEADGELAPSRTVQSGEEQLRDVEARTRQLHRVADVLYERWVAGLV